MKRAEAQTEQAQLHQQAEQAAISLESKTADLRQVEASVETIRQAHYEAGEQVNQAQGQLYQASAEVGRLEAEIRFVVEGRQRAQDRLVQIQTQLEQWRSQSTQAQEESQSLTDNQDVEQEQLAVLREELDLKGSELPALEQRWRDAQQQVLQQSALVNEVQQQIQVLAAEQRGMQEQAQQLAQRQARLQADRQALNLPEDAHLQQLKARLDEAEHQSSQTQAQLQTLEDMAEEVETTRRQATRHGQSRICEMGGVASPSASTQSPARQTSHR